MPRTFTIPTVFRAVDKMSDILRQMGNSVKGFQGTIQTFTARTDRMFRGLMAPLRSVRNALGSVGVYLGGYLIFRAVRNMIKIFADFEQANADLAAVMETTAAKNILLADDAKRLSLTTAKSASDIVALQIELSKLGFGMVQIHNMQEAVITGSIALDASIDRTAALLGHITQQFTYFNKEGADSQHILDVLTKGANDSSLKFSDFETALRQSGPSANAVGIRFERLVALLTALSNSGIDASSSGTALRNIFIDSSAKGHTYEQVLQNILKHQRTLVAAKDKFGRRTAVAAQVLALNLQQVATESLKLETLKLGYTTDIANTKLDTYKGSLLKLKNSYEAFILSIEDGTGVYSNFLKRLNEVLRATLLLANGNTIAMSEFNKLDKKTQGYAKTTLFLLKILKLAVIALLLVKGVALLLQGALYAVNAATWLVTAAQWAWNAAMTANPIGLIVVAIGALIAGVIIMVNKWNEWGAALAVTQAGLGWIISLIQSFRRNWDGIIKSFTDGGFIAGIKKVGAVILDAILMPFQQILKLIHQVTGSEFALKAAVELGKIREKALGVNTTTDESGNKLKPIYNSSVVQQQMIEKRMETQKQQVTMTIDNKSGHGVDIDSSGMDLVPISISSTYSPWYKKP